MAAQAGLAAPAIELKRLPDGPALSLGPAAGEAELGPASMIKVPLAAALCERWAEGSEEPGRRVAVRDEDVTANDLPSPLVPGYRASLEELGRLMLTRSDNVATNVLIRILDRERVTQRCRAWGLEATALRRKLSGALPLVADPGATGRNAHPARDAATLFGQIALGQRAGSGWLLEALGAQEWNDKLSGGLEPGDRFAHKTGETSEVSHDGGILELPGGARYVLVVYSALPGDAGGAPFIRFMRALRAVLA